jgi:hypothetical protein
MNHRAGTIYSSTSATFASSPFVPVAGSAHPVLAMPFGRFSEFKVMQLFQHSTIRSTLDLYTQAVTSVKKSAQAARWRLSFLLNEPRNYMSMRTSQIEVGNRIEVDLIANFLCRCVIGAQPICQSL